MKATCQEEKELNNVLEGPNQGNIYQCDTAYSVQVVTDINVQGFYNYIFEQWQYLKA